MRILIKSSKFIASLLLVICANSAARAQNLPPVYVFGEADSAENRLCSASHDTAIATVQAALRANNVRVVNKDKSMTAISAYVNVNAIKIASHCAIHISLELKNFQFVEDEFLKKIIFASVTYCTKGYTVTGMPYSIYSALLDNLKDMTNQCVSKYIATSEY